MVIFGETGVGKSSVVNMILGENGVKADTSDSAYGCTFDHKSYPVEIEGESYNLYDTAGLNEGGAGTIDGAQAIAKLYGLIDSLSKKGGVNLLIFVMRCGRITESNQKNYQLFYDTFCEGSVPIVVVVTHCENVEPDMESWWPRNERKIEESGMLFKAYACVCSSRGKKRRDGTYSNDQPFEESKGYVEKLIHDNFSPQSWTKVNHIHDFEAVKN